MFQKHYSDTILLRHLDGEISSLTEWRVVRHLKACWRCRNRLGEIQEMIRAAEQDLEEADQAFAGPEWVGDGIERFSDKAQRFERELLRAPKVGQSSWPVFASAMAVVVIGFVVAAAILFRTPPPVEPAFERVVAETHRTEAGLSELPVHQTFRVEVRQIRPVVQV
ncbi:MAG: hypothetical protein GY953_13030, partial [bacterium]|nr:hypothetical protein [bacterium]